MTPTPELTVVLARMEVKLDQIIEKSGDHEARLRKLEDPQTSRVANAKNWPVVLTNALLTVLNATLTSTMVVGG